MASQRHIKTKIRATANIKQITRAMQMVAAAKMRKAEETALEARPYAKKALQLLKNVLRFSVHENIGHAFFKKSSYKKICLVVVTSDKGLCGAFNAAVLRKAAQFIENHPSVTIHVVAVGKKARDFFERKHISVIETFTRFSEITTLYDALPVISYVLEQFDSGNYDSVYVSSTIFASALSQYPRVTHLLPLSIEGLEEIVKNIVPKSERYKALIYEGEEREDKAHPYLFEPSLNLILDELVRDLVRVGLLHLLYESNASEHAARMVAMKNATDNAKQIIETLDRELNKIRQTAITSELAEMSSAREALSGV